MRDPVWQVVTTLGDEASASRMAGEAVRSGHAACAQLEGPVLSHYIWQGKTEKASEYRIVFKVAATRQAGLETWIRENHPYTVPEILSWPAQSGDPAYREWVES